MLIANIILCSVALVVLGWAFYKSYQLNAKEREMVAVVDSVTSLILSAQKIVEKQKSHKVTNGWNGEIDLQNPEMLATLIAVIVNKYGNIRLDVADFTRIPPEDYVSVYVDVSTSTLVLSLNHDLDQTEVDELNTLTNLGNSDDSTFH